MLALASELNLPPETQDPLFDETSQLNTVLESIPQLKFNGLNSEQKWLRIFRGNFPSMFHLISLVFFGSRFKLIYRASLFSFDSTMD